jgi:HRDC domain
VVLPDVAGHGGLSLASGAAEILRGSRSVRFRVEDRGRERRTGQTNRKSGTSGAGLDPAARALWEALRAWRLEEARRQELPPYVIFHDSTLTEVARRRPASLAALAEIPGIGRSKLERYGGAVLAVVVDSIAGTGGGTTAGTPDPAPSVQTQSNDSTSRILQLDRAESMPRLLLLPHGEGRGPFLSRAPAFADVAEFLMPALVHLDL